MSRTWIALALLAAGCDYTGDWLFAGALEDIPGVWVLEDRDSREVVPRVVASPAEIADAVIYAEIGPSGSTEYGGATFDFVGTGADVCVWVDPETAWWNQAVAPAPTDASRKWTYPDNVFDDGDIDLYGGLSVYYTGSPGVRLGDFEVFYEDSLGNEIPISLSECNNLGVQGPNAHAGRGTPEFCTLRTTQVGVSYTIVLQNFSTPLDDDRMGFGLLVVEGSCEDLRTLAGTARFQEDECLILGESIVPQKGDHGPWYGQGAIVSWENSIAFEEHYCGEARMQAYCQEEAEGQLAPGAPGCSWADAPLEGDRCFCGDLSNTPLPGNN
jgi:hypothetical protein